MTPADVDQYVQTFFQEELDADLAFERAVSRRCVYAVAIVVAMVIARAVWFV